MLRIRPFAAIPFAFVLSLIGPLAHAQTGYPVTVRNCFEEATFTAPPSRVVVNDANMVQTFLDLGLSDRLVGVSGIGGVEWAIEGPRDVIGKLKQYSERYPTMEAVLGQNPDFMFAGWLYGFNVAQGITPAALGEMGVATYTMRESCIRIGKREPISMETIFEDIINLGRIFGITERTEALVADWRRRVDAVKAKVAGVVRKPRVMYCGDAEGTPLSIGAEGTPRLLIETAGGENIFNDIPDSYVRVSWEEVIRRDPEWILVSDHRVTAQQTIEKLTGDPQLANVAAVRDRRFIPVTYPQRSPSTRNIETLERIARTLHPELFQ